MATESPTIVRAIDERTLLAVAVALLILEGYDLAALGVTLPSMLADSAFGLSTAGGGIAGAVTALGMLAGAALSGILSHRVGPRRLLVAAAIVLPLGMLVCAAAPAAGVFIAARALVGIGMGMVPPTLLALVTDLSEAGRRARNVGIAMAGIAVGGLSAPLLGAALLPETSFRWIYVIGAIPALGAIPFVVRLLPESPVHLVRTGRAEDAARLTSAMGIPYPTLGEDLGPRGLGLRTLFRPGLGIVTVLFWLMAACALLLVFGVTAWLPTIMQTAGFELGSALLLTAVVAIGAGVGMVVGGRVADAVGPKLVTVVAFASGAASLVLIAQGPPLWALLPLMLVCGFGLNGTQALINAFVLARYPADVRGTGLSWTLAVGRAGAILGPVLGAAVLSSGLAVQWNFYAFAVVGVSGAVLALCVPASRDYASRAADSR
ncbi:MFS transporter [Agromyces rhizosphaerae]|uniref:MFS transporter n=1 Tax=Agromyces rhizosphaerae TaxID=88374 RepID=A0A9W6CV42_9MICO|nr:MFS transporter [Agromyces rhizosphaerae]GLI26935.1 MFS transporter [Agromyces rhizosphaerae]